MIEASRGAPPPEPPALPPPPPQLGCRAAAWRGMRRHAAHRARALAAATARAARPEPGHLAEVRGLILMSPPERAQPMRPREVIDGASNPNPSLVPNPDPNPDSNPNSNPDPKPNPNPDPNPNQVMDAAKQLGLVLTEGGAHLAHLWLAIELARAPLPGGFKRVSLGAQPGFQVRFPSYHPYSRPRPQTCRCSSWCWCYGHG